MSVERMKVAPENVTVLGSRPKGTDDPLWAGLDFAKAEPATQSSLMLMVCGPDDAPEDIHLRVPWLHPEDQEMLGDDPDFWGIYRVRPRMTAGKRWKNRRVVSVAFERWNGTWFIAVRFAGKRRPA